DIFIFIINFMKMNLSFGISLIILLVSQSYVFSWLAIPVVTRTMKGYSFSLFEYNRQLYKTFKELKHKILEDFKNIPKQQLLLQVVGTRKENSKSSMIDKKFIKVDSIFPSNDLVVKLFILGGLRKYECNRNFFTSYYDASKCVSDLIKYSKFKSQIRLVSKDEYGRHTWSFIWHNCFYKCFTRNNYEEMKAKFLSELNMYRLSFNAKPLTTNEFIKKEAEQIALIKKTSQNHKLDNSYYKVIGLTSPPFASLLINRWYAEVLNIKNHINVQKIHTPNVELLFSSNIKHIGIGVTSQNNRIVNLTIHFKNETLKIKNIVYRKKNNLIGNISENLKNDTKNLIIQVIFEHCKHLTSVCRCNNRFIKINLIYPCNCKKIPKPELSIQYSLKKVLYKQILLINLKSTIMLFATSLLISFALQTYAHYLTVPVDYTVYKNGSETFKFQNTVYDNKNSFIKEIKKKLPDVPLNSLLIEVNSGYCKYGSSGIESLNKFVIVALNYPSNCIYIPKSEVFIQIASIKNKLKYKCNSNYFNSYISANQCMKDIIVFDKFKSQEKFLGNDLFGQIVWRSTWKKCYYKCFTGSNFKELIGRLLIELNRYRESFQLKPVVLSYTLYVSALKFAKKMATSGKEFYNKYKKIPMLGVFNVIYKPFGSIQMNKWYTQFLSLKQSNHVLNKVEKKNLNGLFSRHTTKVGFGVVMKENHLYIACMYK
uniref:SCP domain-containing protein n=2 Tax=Strongyloides stercoralis TaxID=6248 RepID=A0AAF5I3U8_STRER